jgi:histidinol-phosphate aminotransferase
MIKKYFREHIAKLVPYSTARDEYSGPPGIFMDANELAFGGELNRYPDPKQLALRQLAAKTKHVNPEMVFVGNGSDEIIDLLIRLFCEPQKDKMLILPPTYGMYAVAAKAHNVEVEEILLKADFQPDVAKVLLSDAKLVFLCSPNNPTGNLMDVVAIEQIAKGFDGIVVVDEAYIDFAPGKSLLPLLNKFSNLVLIQTFSKAFGLAAARVGMAMAHPEIIQALDTIKLPYNLGNPSAFAALAALRMRGNITRQVRRIVRYRDELAFQLAHIKCVEKVFHSDANFLLVRFVDAQSVFRYLLKHGIIVRDRSQQPMLQGCLRITVGTAAQNRRLIEILKTMQ